MDMDRRTFLKTAAAVSLGAVMMDRLTGAEAVSGKLPDMVAVQGGSPAALLDAGLAAYGNIGRFVKPGQTVVIKPNIGWDKEVGTAADTHPELVGHLVELCLKAGAAKVQVFDHTCDSNWQSCYRRSGIEQAVKAAGGVMLCGNLKNGYAPVKVSGGKVIRQAEIFRAVRDCNVFINVPVLKNHGGAKLSCALKNLMGTIWNRPAMHKAGLQQAIADWAGVRKPDLNIVDAYFAMKTGGPRGNARSVILKPESLLISTDMVACDTAGARMLGIDTAAASHIGLAAQMGLGEADLSKVNIRKITLEA